MTTETGKPARFTLDETKAAEWIGKCVALCEDYSAGAPATAVGLIDSVSTDYDQRDYDSHSATGELVSAAHGAGVITGPGEILWDFLADDSGDVGYRWLVDLGNPALASGLRLADLYEDLRHLGDRDAEDGATAALSVLREAVRAGNDMLGQLDAYVAAATS